ncbi:MAG: sigma-70 family RNA polymerase sigma factor [Cellulosilyticaceae bacterium]
MEQFEDIYEKYFLDVYKYVLSLSRNNHIAEEITQETFFKALKSIDSFKGNCKIRVWLCQIAKNTYYSTYRKESNMIEIDSLELIQDNIEQQLIDTERAFELHKALHKMSEPYKEVFSLRMFGELSFTQIGELFSKSESWARVTFHRAKIKLQEEIR